ncbi:MAG: helix-turn-helix domain-containing protein [Lachnospiraceae bacterium]|nr:helix-turn-helix domain-containing protein [Lachnospiraceae bacterium]
MNIGNKIKALRLQSSTTQEILADALGVSSQSVSKWENNICAPDISLLPAISEFFGVTIDELFDLSTEQKLHRIENMLDYEKELTDEQFKTTKEFLLEIKDTYDENHMERPDGRIESFLAHLYHHRMVSDSRYVSLYARKAMTRHPAIKEDQWLLIKAEGATVWDWNARQHGSTIEFYRGLVEKNPEVGINYLFLMDNLIADHRTKEASEYLSKYKTLAEHKAILVPIYEAHIAFAEYRADDAWKIVSEYEKLNDNDYYAVFEIASIYAMNAMYEEALKRYKKAEEIYNTGHLNHGCADHLEAQAQIYEILNKYEDAIEYVNRQIEFLKNEWNLTEGADVDALEEEKKRLISLLK